MPELPEVETVVRTLRPRIVGSVIQTVRLERPDILLPIGTDLAALLRRRSIRSVDRRAKRIMITLDDENQFYIHLGMTGRLTLETPDAPIEKHTHLILELIPASQTRLPKYTGEGTETVHLRFRDPRRFGGVWWVGREDASEVALGPEPLSLRPAQLKAQLQKTRRAIKTALLDQTVIAGIGNIYADEALFAAGIYPLIPANALTTAQVAALNRAIKFVLRKAIHHRGSTLRDYRDANGASGGFQLRHKVYDRAEKPCRVCKTKITRIVVGGRSTHFCSRCQGDAP